MLVDREMPKMEKRTHSKQVNARRNHPYRAMQPKKLIKAFSCFFRSGHKLHKSNSNKQVQMMQQQQQQQFMQQQFSSSQSSSFQQMSSVQQQSSMSYQGRSFNHVFSLERGITQKLSTGVSPTRLDLCTRRI